MKPKSTLRSFLVIASSSLLAVSYSHAQTILADSYLTSLDVSSPTTLSSSLNFPSILNGPLTGSSTLTHTGFFGGQVMIVNNAGNTFDGNINVNSGTLRVAGNQFATGTPAQGFIAPSMTSGDSITIKPGGILLIDDNTIGTTGYVTNRFGSVGNRPVVNMAGGTINLNGLNNTSSSVQTLGVLTPTSGHSRVISSRNGGNPILTFASLSQSSGTLVSFNGSNLGTGANDSRISFTAAPSLTNGILAGARWWDGNPGVSEFVTYDTNGIRLFTNSDYTDYPGNDISGITSPSTQNVRMTGLTPNVFLPLGAPKTINSLHITGGSSGPTWAMGDTLTLTSGMLMRTGQNQAPNITSGTLTAGTGSAPIDLHILPAQNSITIGALIADNTASGVVTLVKGASGGLTLSGTADNTYTGGTYVIDGTLSTGTTADRRYLSSGKVTVDNAILTLGSRGATSNSTGDDYTAINYGRINLGNLAYTAADTFNIAANSIISGNATGLNSLERGVNITLAPNSIIASGALTATLNTSTGTIKTLGSSADLYFGINAAQGNAGGSITIGTGTAFKGISGMRAPNSNTDWQLGTINVAAATTDVYFQASNNLNAVASDVLTLGNSSGANGGPVISMVGMGTLDINVLGRVRVNDTLAVFGETTASKNVRFVATAGSTLEFTQALGMGSGSGVASALVEFGGTLAYNQASDPVDALNGAVTVESGGRYRAMLTNGITGAGVVTFNEGSIIQVDTVLGFSGSQATAATVNPGSIVRLNVAAYGAVGTTLDSFLVGDSPIYQIFNGDRAAANPDAVLFPSGATIMTLNKSGGGVGGILTNDLSSRIASATTNGRITLGANGGVIAATTNTTLTVNEDVAGGALAIGSTSIIDGAPKLGTVLLNVANTYTGGTTVNAGTLSLGNASALGSNSAPLAVNSGGTLNMNNQSFSVGNLTGTGGVISGGNTGGRTLTIGQGDFGGGNYQGSITNGTAGTTNLTKTGTGTITLSGTNTYTGNTTVNGGTLELGADDSLANTSNVLIGNGTLRAANTVNDEVGTLDVTAAATINLGSGSTVAFAASNTVNGGNWAGTLNITGAFVSGSSLRFGTSASGLTSGQLADISASGFSNFALNSSGYLTADGGSGNTAPTISDIANQSVPSGGNTGAVNFTVGDAETPVGSLTLSGSSSNPTLVPNANIVFGGSGASRNVTVTPVSGLASLTPITITITVTDGGSLTAQDTFTLTVTENYLSWATTNGVTGGVNGDHDNDGVKNLVEYALVNGGERGVLSGNTITFTKRGAPYGSDLTYVIETSETLGVGSWSDAVTHGPALLGSNPTISYTFTPSTPVKQFARLKTIQN